MTGLPFDGVEHLVKVVDQFDAEHPEGDEEVPTLAQYLVLLDRLIFNVRAYRSRIEQEVATRAETKVVEFPGGTAQIRAGAKRKNWDWPLLADAVVERALDQGESPKDALIDCIGVTPSHNWRAGALRKRGLEPDDYSEVTYGLPSVQIRTNEGE